MPAHVHITMIIKEEVMDSRESGVHGTGLGGRERDGNDLNMVLMCEILKTKKI